MSEKKPVYSTQNEVGVALPPQFIATPQTTFGYSAPRQPRTLDDLADILPTGHDLKVSFSQGLWLAQIQTATAYVRSASVGSGRTPSEAILAAVHAFHAGVGV